MGVDIQLHKLNHDSCPFKALHDYLIVRKTMFKFQNNSALFIDESGKALEREFFISKLKHLLGICGYNPQSFNGHSIRIGAATTAGKSNIEDHLIKTLGRWNSDSYCRYIRTSKNDESINAVMRLSSAALQDIDWWCVNISNSSAPVQRGSPSITLTTDASLVGWGQNA
ncbi:unnamed protein product [Mytilus coruscus]|uniref:Tyr recombinase domain-containing protein n=1 Tax=Mytilus coruscus TaxID=42192 RepID=A0A6J8CV72_MYTCO|nr:unnamed protein product [Mytilus coruscus]